MATTAPAAGRGVDFLYLPVADLVKVPALERASSFVADEDRPAEGAVGRDRLQAIADGHPRVVAVVGDAVDALDAGKRVFGQDLSPVRLDHEMDVARVVPSNNVVAKPSPSCSARRARAGRRVGLQRSESRRICYSLAPAITLYIEMRRRHHETRDGNT
jgi:hypothetical protein